MSNSMQPGCEQTSTGAATFVGARAYGVAAFCVGIAFILRLAIDPLWGDRVPYAFFFLAVLVVARLTETGPVVFTILAGLILGDWFFVPPRHSLLLQSHIDQAGTVVFVGTSVVVLFFSLRTRWAAAREQAAYGWIAGILECTSDGVCTVDRAWQVIYFNRRASQTTKLENSQVLGRSFWELWSAARGTRFEQEYRRVMEQRQTVHFEEFYPPNNQWLEVHACPYQEGMAIFFRDISARKRAEAARAQLAAIVESSDDAIIGESIEGLIISWNAAAERLYGYTSAEALGHSFAMLFPIERSHEITPVLERVRRGERVSHFETSQRNKGGSLLEVSLTISPVQSADGQVVGVSVTARDISERKRTEQERERLVQQLQSALAEVKTLSGLLPICAHCKKIRDDKGYWNQIEFFIRARSNANFTHSICPDCARQLYPDLYGAPK